MFPSGRRWSVTNSVPINQSPKSAGRRGKRKGKQSLPPLAALEPCRFDESASSANCRFTNGGRTVEIVGEGTALAERDATDEGGKLWVCLHAEKLGGKDSFVGVAEDGSAVSEGQQESNTNTNPPLVGSTEGHDTPRTCSMGAAALCGAVG
jgi:hypothetical protein